MMCVHDKNILAFCLSARPEEIRMIAVEMDINTNGVAPKQRGIDTNRYGRLKDDVKIMLKINTDEWRLHKDCVLYNEHHEPK